MPLYTEVYKRGQWQTIGQLSAGDGAGSLSHNPPGGPRRIYSFECLGDRSIVRRSIGGTDFEVGAVRVISSLEFATVEVLTDANASLEFLLRTDRMPHPVRFRFRHGAA